MLPLFYVADLPMEVDEHCRLVGQVGHHIARVIRSKRGDELLISNGKGAWAKVVIVDVDKSSVELSVLESGYEPSSDISITVVQGITKGDRSRENTELLVQSGADLLIPWKASRSIGKLPDGTDKVKIAVIEAGKQSRRYFLPDVTEAVDISGLLEVIASVDLALVFESSSSEKLTDVLKNNRNIKSVALIIGPEGGITDEELEKIVAAGARRVKLGSAILRSAHAGIAAVAAVSAALEIW